MTHNTSHDETASELANSGECIDGDQWDWKTIRVLCVSGIPKHEAYGMNFDEYRNKREFVTDDTTEKKRLSFYIPTFPTMLNMDFAAMYNASIHRFTLLVLGSCRLIPTNSLVGYSRNSCQPQTLLFVGFYN